MIVRGKTLALVTVLVCALPTIAQELLPMAKGTTWVYLARVKWTGQGTAGGGTRTLRWTSTVADLYKHDDVEAALLHGGPWDLAWYSPAVQPKDYLILRNADAYYFIQNDARATFDGLKSGAMTDLDTKFADDIWFRLPLQVADDFCAPDQEKTSPFNCWSVQKITTTHSFRVPGVHTGPEQQEYLLSFLTNPDTTMVTLVPGAGIVSYYYEHHGTVAEASVKLVEFRAPGAKPARVAPHRRASKTSKVK